MIFSAGLGTRLKPLTDTLPKALVPVAGVPLIEHVSRRLMSFGINEAVVNVHHFADSIEEWIQEQDWLCTDGEPSSGRMLVHVSDERKLLLETGGAVLHARKWLEGCGTFLIHNVDILSDADLGWLESQVRPDALATLLVSRRKSSRYFLFHPETMKLTGWYNSNTGDSILCDPSLEVKDCLALGFSGIHILSDKVFELMDEYVQEKDIADGSEMGVRFAIKDFYLWAASRVPIYGVSADRLNLLDVGKLDAIGPAERFIRG